MNFVSYGKSLKGYDMMKICILCGKPVSKYPEIAKLDICDSCCNKILSEALSK